MKAFLDSTPEPGALGKLLKREYRLGGDVRCRVFAKRRGCLYRVEAGKLTALFKLLPLYESNFHEAVGQMKVLHAVRAAGLAIHEPLKTRGGASVLQIACAEGKRVGILFAWAEGDWEPKKWTQRFRRAYGTLVGDFQRASAGIRETHPLVELGTDYMVGAGLRATQLWLKGKPRLLARFKKSAAWAKAELRRLPVDSATWGLVHGDTHGGNVQFKDGRFQFIDTDQIAYGWRAYDVATYFWGQAYWLGWGGKPDKKLWDDNLRQFLKGYESRRVLSPEERRALPALMVARDFWLTRVYHQCSPTLGSTVFEGLKYFDRSIKVQDFFRKKRALFRSLN